MCQIVNFHQNLMVWFSKSNFDTFWLLYQVPMHIFQNRILRWNHELKLVVLSTINLINGTNIFYLWMGLMQFQTKCLLQKVLIYSLIIILTGAHHHFLILGSPWPPLTFTLVFAISSYSCWYNKYFWTFFNSLYHVECKNTLI